MSKPLLLRKLPHLIFTLIISLITFSLIQLKTADATVVSSTSFTNPLTPGADASITFKDGYYYYVKTQGSYIDVFKTKSLVDLEHATGKRVYTPTTATPSASQEIWAPEIHLINNKWYIYFAADDGSDINHRIYALEGNTADPQGAYTFKGKVYDKANDTWAIDQTVFTHSDGKLYMLWSGRATNSLSQPQNIYIAQMSNPYTLSSKRVLISSPTYSWEKVGSYVNEGPEVLQHGGKTFVIYSASFFNTPDYKLGMLTYRGGNVLSSASWSKSSTPVFQKTATVFGPGHNTLATSNDGSENWIIYHARNTTSTDEPRTIRAQKFSWNATTGAPIFGTPVATTTAVLLPHGDVLGDLVIDSFILTDASGTAKTTFTEGEPIYPKVILHNIGGLGVDTPTNSTLTEFYADAPGSLPKSTPSDVNVYLKNGEFPAEFSKEYAASPVGQNNSFYQGAKSWTKTAGTYTARAFIDYDYAGVESSYANNQVVMTYTVVPSLTTSPTPTP